MSQDTAWIVYGCLWIVPYAFVLTAYMYCLFRCYLSFRMYKYGIVTTGTVVDDWVTNKSGGQGLEPKHHIQYTFDDERSEITDKYIKNTVVKFITNHFEYGYMSNDIINLIIQYIGNAFQFWYGPYYGISVSTKQRYSYGETYNCFEGDPIQIKYDPYYPINSVNMTTVEIGKCMFKCKDIIEWSLILIFISCVCIGNIYGLIQTLNSIDNGLLEMMLIIFGSSTFIAMVIVIYCCYKKRSFCFWSDNHRSLQCDYYS